MPIASNPADRPRVLQSEGRYFAFFPEVGDQPSQTVQLKGWHNLGGTIGREVATAFVELFAAYSRTAKEVVRGQLNKLRHFIADLITNQGRTIRSLTDLRNEDMPAFKAFLEPVKSTRASDWSLARRVIEHACRQAGRPAPQMDGNPWKARPEEWLPDVVPSYPIASQTGREGTEHPPAADKKPLRAGPRALLASMPLTRLARSEPSNVSRLDPNATVIDAADSFVVFFPARGPAEGHRHDFTDWARFDRKIAEEVAEAAITLNRSNSSKSIQTWRTNVRKLLKYLKTIPSNKRPASLADLNSEQMLEFRTFIDKGNIAGRSKIWLAVTAVIRHTCETQSRPMPHFPANPWPGHAARSAGGTAALTTAETGSILSACMRAIDATVAKSHEPGHPGVTLSELFPFVVVLAFWTLFNPETVTGIRFSGVRPDVLGRFAVVGYKGRSGTEQVATFPSTDDHPCAPKRVIDTIRFLTDPLRKRLPPDKRDFLFVGLVRQTQRAKAMVQAYTELNGSMHSYFRDEFCKKYRLKTFNLQQIRTTGAVIVNRLFGGDVKTAQLLLNHLNIATTDSYVQKDALRIEAERVADQMEKRSRFVRSGGLRDVRDQPATPQSAATPGFVCADPFDPPAKLDQEPGMCAAYGACPTCPLASVDRLSAASFAHVLRLRSLIRDVHAEPSLSPQRWIEAWKPRLLAVEQTWLPMFSEDVRAEAAATILDVPMPPLREVAEL